jgi:tetratricopeptide (TPR) repeat protein
VEALPDEVMEADDAEDALVELADYSLATFAEDGESVTVHRVVQEVTRDEQAVAGEADAAFGAALRWLSAAIRNTNAQDVQSWPVLEPLEPHALAALARATDDHESAARAHLLNKFGLLFHTKAQHARAEPLFRRALAIDEARYGPDHPDVARDLNNLAGLLEATNRTGEAEPLYRRALAITEASYGPDHPTVATGLNNLAELLRATNRADEAEPLYRRVVEIFEESYGPDNPNVATGLNNLAAVLYATNRAGEAEPLFRRALAIDEASYGSDHPDVARDLNNLALLLFATNRADEAEPLYRRMSIILLKTSAATGHWHPNLNAGLNNYAGALAGLGRPEEDIRAAIAGAFREAGIEPPDGLA